MPHLNASQERYLRLFSLYVDIHTGEIFDREFSADVDSLRNTGVSTNDYRSVIKGQGDKSLFAQFLQKYDFPYTMANFLRVFISEQKVDPFLIHSGIFFVSEADESATGYNKHKEGYSLYRQIKVSSDDAAPRPELKLVIPAGVKLNEVKEFLEENWRSFVQPRMRLYTTNGSAPNRPIRARRIRIIEQRLLELKEQQKTSKEIAEIINSEFMTEYTYNNINQMYYRMNRN
jgi:hypothetical protein